jgi:transposase-like protein
MGALRKLKDFRLDLLEEYIAGGATIEVACRAVGIATKTYYSWLNSNEEIRDRMEKAKAASEIVLMKSVVNAATQKQVLTERRVRQDSDGNSETEVIERELAPDWRAAMRLLERRFPERYGRIDRVQVQNVKTLRQIDDGGTPERPQLGEAMDAVLEGEFIEIDALPEEGTKDEAGDSGPSEAPS